jgi:cAMP and cAMP-inhibited cGMP 3',5'-cyclic phosphodiesterase 10
VGEIEIMAMMCISELLMKKKTLCCRSIFQDMVSMDTLIMKIMNFAQRLVDADRASLFLVDSKNKELYARIFDVGITGNNAEDTKTGGNISGSEEAIAKVQNSTEIRYFFISTKSVQ